MNAAHSQDDLDREVREAHRQEMLSRHLSLVHHVARQLARSGPAEMELDDLISAGTLGLISAIESFDASRGLRFSTFAAPRIRGAILDDLRRRDHVPRSIRRKQRALSAAEDDAASRLRRAPTSAEVAHQAGIEVETLWRWRYDAAQAGRVSIDAPVDGDAEFSSPPAAALLGSDGTEVENRITAAEESALLRDAILELKPQERIVLSLYYFEELKLHEIASVLGVTESRVSQIHAKAVVALRTRMAGVRGGVS